MHKIFSDNLRAQDMFFFWLSRLYTYSFSYLINYSLLPEESSRLSWTPSLLANLPKMVIQEWRWVVKISKQMFLWYLTHFIFISGSSGSYSYWNHHSGYPYPECFGREGTSYSWTDICCSEEVRVPRGNSWALCWEGCYPRSVCHCPGWITSL